MLNAVFQGLAATGWLDTGRFQKLFITRPPPPRLPPPDSLAKGFGHRQLCVLDTLTHLTWRLTKKEGRKEEGKKVKIKRDGMYTTHFLPKRGVQI